MKMGDPYLKTITNFKAATAKLETRLRAYTEHGPPVTAKEACR